MVDTKIVEIVWCYGEWQKLYTTIKDKRVKFHEGMINSSEFNPDSGAKLVILDDMMREADERVVDLFTKGSHHRSLSVVFITQNLFHQGKGRRDISLNAHYVVAFRNPRDRGQIAHFSRQINPQDPKHILEAFENSTSEAHGYLVFDFKQSTPDSHRLLTKIFPDDGATILYLPKKGAIKPDLLFQF
jgi:hypothetical protein